MSALSFRLTSTLVLLTWVGLPACDNPVCVFSTQGCNSAGSGDETVGSAQASLPSDGARILGAPPRLLEALPNGDGQNLTTPIVLRFNESMNPDSLEDAFVLGDRFSGTVFPLQDPPVLVGDGRVVVLQPATPLPDGLEFELTVSPTAVISDVTGQEWVFDPNDLIVSFGTDQDVNVTPRVLLTEPSANDTNVSDLTEISVVFDRRMDPTRFNQRSFAVTVGGMDPDPDPNAMPGFSGSTAIESVWTWQSEDAFGARVSLGDGDSMQWTLSPASDRLADLEGNELPEVSIPFTLSSALAPVGGLKPFGAQDAIGRSDLENAALPVLQVELSEPTQMGDELLVYLFGSDPEDNGLIAFERLVPVADGLQLIDLLPADLALLDLDDQPLLADDDLRVGVRLQRGNVATAVRVLDGSPLLDGVQDYLFDSMAPSIVTVGLGSEPTTMLRSDQRDLVVVGLASEGLAGARVSSALGNNVVTLDPPAPTQVGAQNIFVAAPIPVGLLDPTSPPINFDLQAFDNALNTPTMPFAGSFEQVGVAATGSVIAGTSVQVWVHHSETLAPLQGARIFSHQDSGGITFLGSSLTNTAGTASVTGAAVGETLITVDLPGYHLFTFHGAPRDRIMVLLEPITPPLAQWVGQVQSAFPAAPIQNVDVFVADTRLGGKGPLARTTEPCTLDTAAGLYRCSFVPEIGRTQRVGFGAFVAGDRSLPEVAFSPLSFLRAYGWETGQPSLATDGLPTPSVVFVDTLLTTGVVEDLPIEVPAQVLNVATAPNMGTLAYDPLVLVDSLSPGMERPILVGLGIAYDQGGNLWNIRSAIPGVVDGVMDSMDDELGVLVEFGAISPDHFLRVEVQDEDGNLSVVRRPFSQLDGNLILTDPSELVSPAPAGAVSGSAYTVQCTDPLRDLLGMGGLYEVRLVAQSGRSWSLWRQDPGDGVGSLEVSLPDIEANGGAALPDGPIGCQISYFAAPTLDPTEFLWTDLYREAHHYARSEVFLYTQTP